MPGPPVDPTVALLKSIGVWQLPHPWLTLFLPAARTPAYVANVLSTLTLAFADSVSARALVAAMWCNSAATERHGDQLVLQCPQHLAAP